MESGNYGTDPRVLGSEVLRVMAAIDEDAQFLEAYKERYAKQLEKGQDCTEVLKHIARMEERKARFDANLKALRQMGTWHQ